MNSLCEDKRANMKIAPYIQKLENSAIYKKFRKDYSDAFAVAGFFVLDYESGANIHQIDYYVPSKKKVAAFNLDGNVEVRLLDMMHPDKKPEKLDIKTRIDLDALKGIVEDEMKNRNITESVKKCVAVIQTIDGKKLWVLNCILSGMEILKAHVEDDSRTVLKMEKSNMLDYVKKIPMQQLAAQKLSKDDLAKQIEQLDKLKEQLKKEEADMEKSGSQKNNKK